MNAFLLRLLALMALFFRPAVDGDPEDPADPEPEDPPADPDPQPELDLDPADPEPEPRVEPKEELEAERRARAAERDRADRAERELAEARRQPVRQPQDNEVEQEDRKLADPNTTALEKWQIQANRELRAGRTAAQAALAQAQDVRDQTAFNQLAITEPALHKRYSVKVEQELVNARRAGYNPNREYIYNQLIAKDMREGKFKRKAAAAAGDPAPKAGVQRGKLPGARADVPAKAGSMSNRDRLAKKLDGVNI